MILVTITDVPPRARRLLCNGYKHASMRSEDELSNVTLNQGDRSLIQAWIKDLSPRFMVSKQKPHAIRRHSFSCSESIATSASASVAVSDMNF